MERLVRLALACLLFSKACPLRCYDCVSDNQTLCQGYKMCLSTVSRCGSAVFAKGGGTVQRVTHTKGCVEPEQCSSGSVSFGSERVLYHTECCDSDLCNDGMLNVPTDMSQNGKKCFSCEKNNCTHIIDCWRNENICFTATVWINLTKRENYRGCVSENLCPVDEDTVQLSSLLGARVKCCHGELCNSARRTERHAPPTLLALLASIALLR
ncbi:urokinase plasminogen activator surface receptor-like [Brienomyrus brachyistius]|uniref:urokinase plasminogen activator surface receptor-like n=1 Tax=Brienomyrus brachyistius TaxID=42636 RepID=UPI0020B38C53|nr:urokinase plasminogen activator surface receptor-like [Brienomyrus brachyistius]